MECTERRLKEREEDRNKGESERGLRGVG